MAAGVPPPDNSSDRLTSIIFTLKNCLEIVEPGSSAVEKVPVVSRQNSSPNVGLMPDGTQWPHDQHSITNDESREVITDRIKFVQYKDETQITDVMRLMTKDLSEPYSIYTYRFFVHNWPELCILAFDTLSNECVGAVVGKLEHQSDGRRKGYVAMLAVDDSCRRMGLGTKLVRRAIDNMRRNGCDEVYLETEVSNTTAQGLYAKLGFIRDKRLIRYYLNGNDAFRLKLFFTPTC